MNDILLRIKSELADPSWAIEMLVATKLINNKVIFLLIFLILFLFEVSMPFHLLISGSTHRISVQKSMGSLLIKRIISSQCRLEEVSAK